MRASRMNYGFVVERGCAEVAVQTLVGQQLKQGGPDHLPGGPRLELARQMSQGCRCRVDQPDGPIKQFLRNFHLAIPPQKSGVC